MLATFCDMGPINTMNSEAYQLGFVLLGNRCSDRQLQYQKMNSLIGGGHQSKPATYVPIGLSIVVFVVIVFVVVVFLVVVIVVGERGH